MNLQNCKFLVARGDWATILVLNTADAETEIFGDI